MKMYKTNSTHKTEATDDYLTLTVNELSSESELIKITLISQPSAMVI